MILLFLFLFLIKFSSCILVYLNYAFCLFSETFYYLLKKKKEFLPVLRHGVSLFLICLCMFIMIGLINCGKSHDAIESLTVLYIKRLIL